MDLYALWPEPRLLQALVLLIGGAALLAFGSVASWAWGLRRERARLEASGVGRVPPADLDSVLEYAAGLDSGLVQRWLSAAKAYRSAGMLQEDSTALADLFHQEAKGALAWSRYLASALVFLGLLGTVLGLALALADLWPVLQSIKITRVQDISQLVDHIAGMLGSMRGAFACTLWGVLASLVVSLVNQAAWRYYEKHLQAPLERYCVTHVIPAGRRTDHLSEVERALQAAQAAAQSFQASAEAMNGAVIGFEQASQRASDAFASTLSAAASQLQETTQAVSQQWTNDIAAASRKLQTTTAEAGDRLLAGADRYAELLDGVTGSLGAIHESLAPYQEEVRGHLASVLRLNQESAAQVAQVTALLERASGAVDGLVASFTEKALESLRAQSEQWRQDLRADIAASRQVSMGAASLLEAQVEQAGTLVKDAAAGLQMMTTSISGCYQAFRAGVDRLAAAADHLIEAHGVVVADLRRAVQDQQAALNEHSRRFSESTSQSLAGLTEGQEQLRQDLALRSDRQTEELGRLLDRQLQSLERLRDGLLADTHQQAVLLQDAALRIERSMSALERLTESAEAAYRGAEGLLAVTPFDRLERRLRELEGQARSDGLGASPTVPGASA